MTQTLTVSRNMPLGASKTATGPARSNIVCEPGRARGFVASVRQLSTSLVLVSQRSLPLSLSTLGHLLLVLRSVEKAVDNYVDSELAAGRFLVPFCSTGSQVERHGFGSRKWTVMGPSMFHVKHTTAYGARSSQGAINTLDTAISREFRHPKSPTAPRKKVVSCDAIYTR